MRIPAGARLSPAAADFVAQWDLLVDEAPGPVREPSDVRSEGARAPWDVPSRFPVAPSDAPLCTACGSAVRDKAAGQTQLNATHYSAKTHPRIVLRGRVDSLHAFVLLAQHQALSTGKSEAAASLGSLAAYCRELTSAEYNERPVADAVIDGLDFEAIHRVTHDPRAELGIDHLTIDGSASMLHHLLNVLRTQSREVEIIALEAFPSPHHPYGASICHALNRFSSIAYYLQLRLAVSEQ